MDLYRRFVAHYAYHVNFVIDDTLREGCHSCVLNEPGGHDCHPSRAALLRALPCAKNKLDLTDVIGTFVMHYGRGVEEVDHETFQTDVVETLIQMRAHLFN